MTFISAFDPTVTLKSILLRTKVALLIFNQLLPFLIR